MSRYNRCNECYNMKCVFVTGERQDFDTSECADFRPLTNADRIRAMTDEELARLFDDILKYNVVGEPDENVCSDCYKTDCAPCWLDWLKAEVDNG